MDQNQIKPEQIIQMQFNKIGQLTFQIDLMQQQLMVLGDENKSLKEQLTNGSVDTKSLLDGVTDNEDTIPR